MKLKGVSLAAILLAVLCISGNLLAYSGGDGSAGFPYQIANVADLGQLSATPDDWSSSFILTADINLTGLPFTQAVIAPDTDTYDETDEFQGIPFTGIFDGNGHVISNLTITAPEKDFISLFGAVGTGGQVKNLGVKYVSLVGRSDICGLAGYNDGSITGCYATGSVNGASNVGGLVGWNGSGTLTDCYATAVCYATGSVSIFSWVGGLIGYNASGSLTNCYAAGSVTGTEGGVGGLIGWADGGTLTDCHATGLVNGPDYTGGLAGSIYSCTLTNCYAAGSVSGAGDVGGLVGNDYSCMIINCYATGSVNGTDHIGGLVGSNSSWILTGCYATGSVTGTNFVGGLMGANDSTLTNCYATGSVTGTGTSEYIGGLAGSNGSTLTSCYATGSVSGSGDVGGLAGYEIGGQITNCYATGSVTGGDYVGGLAGEIHSSTLTDCYAIGLVAGSSNIGGLVGVNYYTTLTGCFWDINTSRTNDGVGNVDPDPAGVTGKTTAQMKTLSTFTSAGWNFTTVWVMLRPGEDYPRLAWQTIYPGDIAGLYGVNFIDYSKMAAHWHQTGCPTGCEGADINGDGKVNMNDLMLFADNWLAGF